MVSSRISGFRNCMTSLWPASDVSSPQILAMDADQHWLWVNMKVISSRGIPHEASQYTPLGRQQALRMQAIAVRIVRQLLWRIGTEWDLRIDDTTTGIARSYFIQAFIDILSDS